MSYTTTIDQMGDKPARDALISGNINTFIDDDIISPPTYFMYENNFLISLSLMSVIKLLSYSIRDCHSLGSLELPNLEEISGSYSIEDLSNLEIIGDDPLVTGPILPKLKYIKGNGSVRYLTKLQKLSLPELIYAASDSLNYNSNLTILRVPKLEVCDTNFYSLSKLLSFELPSVKLLCLNSNYSPYQEYWYRMASNLFYGCSMLRTINISSEILYVINLSQGFYSSSGVATVDLIIRSKIIPYLQAFQLSVNPGEGRTLNIRVPFHLLNDYRNDTFWGSTNYLSKLTPIETIDTEYSSSITVADSEIPYWATSNEITCTLNCDWTDNITATAHTNENVTYTVHKRLTPYLGTSQRTVTLTQQYGSQQLSVQCTQTPIDFSVGYSVPDQTSWHYVGDWGTLQDPNPALQPLKENHVLTYHNNYVYFTCDGFHDSNIEFYKKRSGIDMYHLIKIPDECDYFKNSICIFFNGYTSFDFYIIQNTNYGGNRIVVLPIDQYYPDVNTVPPAYNDISDPSYNGPYYITDNISDTGTYSHYHKSTQEGVPDSNDALAFPTDNWHRVRFTNLDGGPHFVRIIEYSTSHTQDRATYYLNRPIIAINKNNYTYHPIQTV